MDNVSFNPSFQGKFLNPNLVYRAAKKSQRAYMGCACKTGGVKLDETNTATFKNKADEIVKFLNELAAKLPDNVNLVLTKERGREYKTLCLDLDGPLGRTEFMGNVTNCRKYNTPRSYTESYNLECVEVAIEPLRIPNEYRNRRSTLWSRTSEPEEEHIIRKYISFIETRIEKMIEKGKIRKVPEMIEKLADFAKENGFDERAKRVKENLNYKLDQYKNIQTTKKENCRFKLKSFFGL